VVLIQETKCDKITMTKLAQKIWKSCQVEVFESDGASGGLAILWDPSKWHLETVSNLPIILTMSFEEIGSQSQGFIQMLMAR
jgi:hypothetical protein